MYPVELLGARLRLRELSLDDAKVVSRMASHQEGLFFPGGTPTDVDSVWAWIQELLVHAKSPARAKYRFAITDRSTGDLYGTVRIEIEHAHDRWGTLGYALSSEHWGRGYATEAAGLAVGFGFERLRLHRIEATIEPVNTASINVSEKLGMRREGLLKGRLRSPRGWHDAYLYAILEEEWREEVSSSGR